MKRKPAFPRPRRLVADAMTGLALFTVLTVALGGIGDALSVGTALAADSPSLDAEGVGGVAVAGFLQAASVAPAPAAKLAVLAVLGAAFASIFAFNLAFARHLRRVYASPRRDGWRRSR